MISSVENLISQLEDITEQLKFFKEKNLQSEKELNNLKVENWELKQKLEVQRKETERWKQISFQQNKR